MQAAGTSTPMNLFFRTAFARAYPRLIGLFREKSWLFFGVVLPVLNIAAYVLIYRVLGASSDFEGFAVFGGAMTAFWLNMLWGMATQLYWDKEGGNLALFIQSPASLMAIMLGMAVGGLFNTIIRAAVTIIAGSLIFQVSFIADDLGILILVFILTMIALYGMGMLSASLFLLMGRKAQHINDLLQEPIYLVSGFFFPLKFMNFWIALTASIIPLSLGIDAMRQCIFRTGKSLGFLDIWLEVIILTGLCIIYLPVARLLLDFIERKAIREGKLTERGE